MDNNMKTCCVTAVHIQPSEEWINALPNCDVIIIDDNPTRIIDKQCLLPTIFI